MQVSALNTMVDDYLKLIPIIDRINKNNKKLILWGSGSTIMTLSDVKSVSTNSTEYFLIQPKAKYMFYVWKRQAYVPILKSTIK